jgi:hypothetical protein
VSHIGWKKRLVFGLDDPLKHCVRCIGKRGRGLAYEQMTDRRQKIAYRG